MGGCDEKPRMFCFSTVSRELADDGTGREERRSSRGISADKDMGGYHELSRKLKDRDKAAGFVACSI